MSGNILRPDFNKKRVRKTPVEQRKPLLSDGDSVRDMFTGYAHNRPPLITQEVLRDITRRISEISANYDYLVDADAKIARKKLDNRAANAALWRADLRFYLQVEGQRVEQEPFMTFRAEHIPVQEGSDIVRTRYTVHRNDPDASVVSFEKGIEGANYEKELAPVIEQMIRATLSTAYSKLDPEIIKRGSGYEPWKP